MVSDVELGEVLQMPPYHDPDNRQGNCKVAEPESYLQPIYWVTMILKNNLKVKQEESRAEWTVQTMECSAVCSMATEGWWKKDGEGDNGGGYGLTSNMGACILNQMVMNLLLN